MKSFALALGSGAARGLAHIAVLEALDEMGVKPKVIAGTSIGALLGAAYASGLSGKDIRHHVLALAHGRGELRRRFIKARAGSLADIFSGGFSRAAQIDAEKACAQFLPENFPADFSELEIPLIVMATDLHSRQEAPLSSGPLHPALAASIAIPGVFLPVVIDGRVLIDGGTTNPLPYEQLIGVADVVVAVDVFGVPATERTDMPSIWESLYITVLVMGGAILAAKMNRTAPDLLLRPNVTIFRGMDFSQASAIIRSAEATKNELKEKLGALLNAAL
ncbi:MAG TPA: patatin-like phospholipase family protein [Xanthobacteraceae bacterium]|jgi:NTE family protein|nr:patatin-like phospholipase family protein [Xanthobacteraceae bacterium]